jgi:chromo domain-containing protein 1
MRDFYYSPDVVEGAGVSAEKKHNFANTKMVEYFGGMVVDQRQYYRQYFVVHTDPGAAVARDWKKRIGIVDEVMTPEMCIGHLGGEPKGNRFEFYEWAFAEKMVDGVVG